jgi:hypothetical protein
LIASLHSKTELAVFSYYSVNYYDTITKRGYQI